MADILSQEKIDDLLSSVDSKTKWETKEISLADALYNEIVNGVRKEIGIINQKLHSLTRDSELTNETIRVIIENQSPAKKQKIIVNSNRYHNTITINGKHDYIGIIKHLVSFSDKARREGILALEKLNDMTKNKLMKKGIELSLDGTEPSLIQEVLQTDINENKRRGEFLIKFYSALSNFVLVAGILITLYVIIRFDKFEYFMLLPATIALFIKYIVFGSGVWLKRLKMEKDMTICAIIVSGVMSIQAGDNPRIVEEKLLMFLPEKERENYFKEYKR